MHRPDNGSRRTGGQWDWVSQLLGEEIWEQVQEGVRGTRSAAFPFGRSEARSAAGSAAHPALDLYLTAYEVVLSVALPGLTSPNHVVVSLADPLTLVLEAYLEPPPQQAAVLHRERQTGFISRTISLPAAVRAVDLPVRYQSGVLELRLPLAQPGNGENVVSLLNVE